jgi:hypothetical protein
VIYVKKLTRTDPDVAEVEKWLAEDEFHQVQGITIDDLFAPNTEAAIIYDERGPIQAVRFSRALRAASQFNPNARLRNARAGAEVAKWFQTLAKDSSCTEVIIRPGGKAVRFTEKLGFLPFIGKYLSAGG